MPTEPTQTDPPKVVVAVRFPAREAEEIRERARRDGVTPSDELRAAWDAYRRDGRAA